MTQAEEKKINELWTLLRSITEENKKFREDTSLLVKVLNDKLDQKFLPVTLEENILQTAQQAIHKSIGDALGGYNSPLVKLTNQVITKHEKQLTAIIENCFEEVINTSDFRKSIFQSFTHKIAKNIVNGSEGVIDKVTNDLKQNPTFRAKATLAINDVITEILEK